MFEKVDEEVKAFFVKILIPTIAWVSLKLSVLAMVRKVTWFDAATSLTIAIVFSSTFTPVIMHYLEPRWNNPVVAVLTLSADRVTLYYIQKFKVDNFVRDLLSGLIQKYFKK